MTIKETFIGEHSLVKVIFGRKKLLPKMAVFRKFKDLNIKYSHQDPQKALPCPEQNWRTTVVHIIKQNTRVHDAHQLQLI